MNKQEMNQDSNINEDVMDLFGEGLELDLGSTPMKQFDPFGDTSFADEQIPEEPKRSSPVAYTTNNSKKTKSDVVNPLEKAMESAEAKDTEEAQKSLFEKPPIFTYAAASDDVEDTSMTFEELRIEKVPDFPELEDGKRVSWTVEYGKISKLVANPKNTTIAKMKSDIETSKVFLDSLKKAKVKNPDCKLKPRVTAQSKGKIPAYKGVYTSIDEAASSDKVITMFPARDGRVYEMRQNEMGRFITPTRGSNMLSDVTAGFTPALPPIPCSYLFSIIRFFRRMAKNGCYEALINIYWDKIDQTYILNIPKQTVTAISVSSEVDPYYEKERYIHYMDVHSHNKMRAFFSSTDDEDEKATRVYAVIGSVMNCFPEIKARISNGGTFLDIEPEVVFEKFTPEMYCLLFLDLMSLRTSQNTEKYIKSLTVGGRL